MINDILALQYLYGTNETHNRGDTTYDLTNRAVLHETIWDAGGIDTLTWAGQTTSARFNLNPGTFSSFGAITGPDSPILEFGDFPDGSGLLGIAEGTVIENVIGGSADDVIYANAAANAIDGGAGEDLVSYRYSNQGVTVSLLTGQGTGGDAAGDTLTNIENLAGSALADVLTGDGQDNRLEGLAGADQLNGGGGDDTASYAQSDAGVTVSLLTGEGTGGDAEGDRLTHIENLEGSTHNDTLTGNNQNNRRKAWRGHD